MHACAPLSDSYWIIKGLLASNMCDTARGMVQNMLHQLRTYGFIPNGGRLYYLNRSQPPMLSDCVAALMADSFDLEVHRNAPHASQPLPGLFARLASDGPASSFSACRVSSAASRGAAAPARRGP